VKVLKFGGASVKNADGVRNLARIVKSFDTLSNILIVVSAMGKTTNKLEELLNLAHSKNDYSAILDELKSYHRAIAEELTGKVPQEYIKLEESLSESLKTASEYPITMAYDIIVPHGELISTTIIQCYLKTQLENVSWLDAREIIRTDQYFTEANIDWVVTNRLINQKVPNMVSNGIAITQGFIGSDVEGNTTTLGREGSDFTGSILAHCLNAESFSVFKDVKGILNADPRILENTEKYDQLSYREVTEMTYYGAQVIHPKTLKPLAQKGIPLIVRSFINPKETGSVICDEPSQKNVPCYVFKLNQILVTAQVKDHSFMDEKKLGMILQVLDLLNIKINLMQNSALTLSFCIDHKEFKIKRIKELLNRDFILSFEKDLKIATIKNYTEDSFKFLPKDRNVIMEQKTPDNYQVVYRLS